MSLFGVDIGDVVDTVGGAASAAGAAVGNVGEEIGDFFTGEDSDHERYVREVQERGNAQREGIYADEARARAQLAQGGGVLPTTVMPEAFDAMTHEGILAHVSALAAGRVAQSSTAFHNIQDRIGALGETLGAQLRSALSGEWEGDTADGAAAAVGGYTAAMSHLTASLTVVSGKLAEAGSGFEQTALMIPPASGISGTDVLRVATSFVSPPALMGTLSDVMAKKEEARQQAIAVMKTVYTPVVVQSDTGVPVLPPPLAPTTGVVAGGDSPTTGGGVGSGWPSAVSNASPGGSSAGEASTSAPDTRPANTNAAAADTSSNGAAGAGNSATGNSTNGTSGPAGSGAGTSIAQAPGTAPGQTGGFMRGPSSPRSPFGQGRGAGSGAGSRSGWSTTSPYAVSAGPLGSAGAAGGGTAPGSGGASGVTAARGGYGSGAIMPGGAGARGDNDTEHTTPGYLVSVDNGDELIGALPPVVPPVIGS